MAATEATARLEAKLRRGDASFAHSHLVGASSAVWHVMLDNNRDMPATDPHTAEGALVWLGELFEVECQLGRSYNRRWYCALEANHLIGRGDTLLEAIAAAIEAAAEQHAKESAAR